MNKFPLTDNTEKFLIDNKLDNQQMDKYFVDTKLIDSCAIVSNTGVGNLFVCGIIIASAFGVVIVIGLGFSLDIKL